MKAIVATGYGPPEVLRLTEVEEPVPGDDELLVRVTATTVTTGDARIRASRFPPWFRIPSRLLYGFKRPRKDIPGNEFAGVVQGVGRAVTRFSPGDEVLGILWGTAFAGANAEFLCIGEDQMVAAKPDAVTHEEAAALPVGGLSALHFLRRAGVRGGQSVLVVGGSGSVGTFAVQLARHLLSGVPRPTGRRRHLRHDRLADRTGAVDPNPRGAAGRDRDRREEPRRPQLPGGPRRGR